MENIAVGAVRDWIGVMNSEKKYRHTLESCGNPAEPKKNIMLIWQNIRRIGRQARSFIDQHTRQES